MAYVRGVPAFGQQHPADTAGSAGPGHARAVVLVLYTIGFFSAGLVTPGLEHMVLGIAPQGGRGQFYAVKSIIGTCVSSAATLALGRVLDYYLEQGQGYTGFLIIGIVSLSLTVVDAVLLASVRENPVKFTSKMRPADILRPVRDPAYRPLPFLLHHRRADWRLCFSVPFRV